MMIDDLRSVIRKNAGIGNRDYLLNLLKESLQNYILSFIYTGAKHKKLIFTGGTCLRKVYGLNRLSADLDFDYEDAWDRETFALELREWFMREHQLNNIEVTNRRQSTKVKLTDAAAALPEIGKGVLFVTVDVSPLLSRHYETENSLLSTHMLSLIVRNYSLPTLFAKKVAAFLTRDFRAGKTQGVSFKARDVYDLYWLCQMSKRSGYSLRANSRTLLEEAKTDDVSDVYRRVCEKIDRIDDNDVRTQLAPFFHDADFVENFSSIYKKSIVAELKIVLKI